MVQKTPKWTKISTKRYAFEGQFSPDQIYEEIKKYLERKQYNITESELEYDNLPGRSHIFTHIIADLELTRRYYIKLAFSINMKGSQIDTNGIVNGSLELYVNGFIQQHSLLFEQKETFFTVLLTKFYDRFIDPDAKPKAIVSLIVEMGKLMAEVKSKLDRR